MLIAGLLASGNLPSLAGDIKPDDVIITLSISRNGFNLASCSVSILPLLVAVFGETSPAMLFSAPGSVLTPAVTPSPKIVRLPFSSSSY